MTTQRPPIWAFMNLVSWGFLGAVIGLGGGYLIYVKKSVIFESSAQLQIESTVARQPVAAPPATGADAPPPLAPPFAVSQEITDESAVMLGQPVLMKAVKEGQLAGLSEFRGDAGSSADLSEIVRQLQISGKLQAKRTGNTAGGAVYEIYFRGQTPSSTQQVVAAIVWAYQEINKDQQDLGAWEEAMKVLASSRSEVAERMKILELRDKALAVPSEIALEGGKVISAEAERLRQLRSAADRLQGTALTLQQKLRATEALIAQDAQPATVLASLGYKNGNAALPPVASQENVPTELARSEENSRIAQEQHESSLRAVEQELIPMQLELDRLLEKYGKEHPTVRSLVRRMDIVRAKVSPLPQRPAAVSTAAASLAPAAATETSKQPPSQEPTSQELIDQQLSLLQAQLQSAAKEFQKISGELMRAAEVVAKQQQVLEAQQTIQLEMQQLRALEEQVTVRLKQLPIVMPVSQTTCTVLRSPSPGVPVEPRLTPHLTTGGLLGFCAAALLAGLLMLTTLAETPAVAHEED